MDRRLLLLLPLLLLIACGESGTDPDPVDPGKARALFVHGLTGLDSLEFQGRPLEGASIVTIGPRLITWAGVSRYLTISALRTELRAVDPETNEVRAAAELVPAIDSAYSFFGYRNEADQFVGLVLNDDLRRDTAGRQGLRGVNLIAGVDSLRFRFIAVDSMTAALPIALYGAPSSLFTPLFDSTTTTVTLVVDIIDETLPEGFGTLFTGDVPLPANRLYTIAAVGTPTLAQIVVVPHLQLL